MLTPKQKKLLKAEAHHLKPVLHIGKSGVTDALVSELDTILDSLELIKVKLNQNAIEDEDSVAASLMEKLPGMEHVWTIGHTLLLFRPSRTHSTKYVV
ncbi:MAG: ribosome assembly RNA-binding protein YhbY [Holophagaceae bacterium]|nr:ribosome assembly RNA-binding protein YhbY [Holophagaceae bacterium]